MRCLNLPTALMRYILVLKSRISCLLQQNHLPQEPNILCANLNENYKIFHTNLICAKYIINYGIITDFSQHKWQLCNCLRLLLSKKCSLSILIHVNDKLKMMWQLWKIIMVKWFEFKTLKTMIDIRAVAAGSHWIP